MTPESAQDRLSTALERVLAGLDSGLPEGDELFEFLGTAAFLRESLTTVPAPEAFRTSLREWLESEPAQGWWDHVFEPLQRRLPPRHRPPAVGVVMGAGAAAAAILIGVLVVRNRRASVQRIAG